eukprot:1157822-Pelagomonas_calceolata.AAC.21
MKRIAEGFHALAPDPSDPMPRYGFTPEQLDVLKNQILVFRELLKGSMPEEIESLKPKELPMHLRYIMPSQPQLQPPHTAAAGAGWEREQHEGCRNAPALAGFQAPKCISRVGWRGSDVSEKKLLGEEWSLHHPTHGSWTMNSRLCCSCSCCPAKLSKTALCSSLAYFLSYPFGCPSSPFFAAAAAGAAVVVLVLAYQ